MDLINILQNLLCFALAYVSLLTIVFRFLEALIRLIAIVLERNDQVKDQEQQQ